MRLQMYHKHIFANDLQWAVLFKLAENPAQSFNAAKSRSSAQSSADQLFALLRLADNRI